MVNQGHHRVQVLSLADHSTSNSNINATNTQSSNSTSFPILHTFGCEGSAPGQFEFPSGATVQPSTHHVIIADLGNHRVQVFAPLGSHHLYTIGGVQRSRAFAKFNSPQGVACSNSGEIAVADTSNHRVQVFDPRGRFLLSLGAGKGTNRDQLIFPWDVAVQARASAILPSSFSSSSSSSSLSTPLNSFGGDEQIYVADYRNQRVSVWSRRTAQLITTFPVQSQPRRLCLDVDGHVIVGCSDDSIQKFDVRNFQVLETLNVEPGQFSWVAGLCIDPFNNLFVADASLHRVQMFMNHKSASSNNTSHNSAPQMPHS